MLGMKESAKPASECANACKNDEIPAFYQVYFGLDLHKVVEMGRMPIFF